MVNREKCSLIVNYETCVVMTGNFPIVRLEDWPQDSVSKELLA